MITTTNTTLPPPCVLYRGFPTDGTAAQRERLAVLVSTGKSKEAIGVQLLHDQVKRLSDKEVAKLFKRYEAYVGNKTTESLIDSVLMLVI